MGKYRKRPVVIEAVKWDPDTKFDDMPAWVFEAFEEHTLFKRFENDAFHTYVATLEGYMRVGDGDYIVKGVRGELYPCKADIFEETYEPVVEPSEEMIQMKHDELETTVDGMLSDDPNDRLQAEENQLKIRIGKLRDFISAVKEGRYLEMKLRTPLSMLEEQLARMEALEEILSERLEIEQEGDNDKPEDSD